MLALVDTNNKVSVFGKKMHSNDSVCDNSRDVYILNWYYNW